MPKDHADLHVERWRDHWIDVNFDDEVEAMTVRISKLQHYFRQAKQAALADAGLQDFEYDTLHKLMIRDTPGRASPGDLGRDLDVSGAGMTGRLDGLEKRGFLKRTPAPEDRRRVDIEVTREGAAIWRRAMSGRGVAEDELAAALTRKELVTLNRLLKKLTLYVEQLPEVSIPMRAVVWIDSWQMQCCGETFAVGDTVTWTASDTPDRDWLENAVGAETARAITHAEDHHGVDDAGLELTGRVLAISSASCNYAPSPTEFRTSIRCQEPPY